MNNTKKRRDVKANREKKEILNPAEVERNKKKKHKKIWIGIIIAIFAVVAVGFICYQAVRAVGKHKLSESEVSAVPEVEKAEYSEEVTEEEQTSWKEGWIKYQGKIYEFNSNVQSFLVMGIDKDSDVEEVAEGQHGGQADFLMLVIVNPNDETIRLLTINRNTMSEIDFYDEYGAYETTGTAQIAVAHGFGNGMQESCEYEVKAVKKLLYGIPINGYAAINMSAISTLNDIVGGVTLTTLEDVIDYHGNLVINAGETVTLDGNQAYLYLRKRDVNEFGSADNRLARQKQYLEKYITALKTKIKQDPGTALDLYNAISAQMVTDITASEAAYLATTYSDYSFNMNNMYSIPGETSMGEKFEEYWVDDQGLYELILELYYNVVGEY